ncbi:MAG TPA: hypothetical protein VEY06_03235 [Flavisolibacter sp.]|nr:hypothetical protein [Flavisolibacter sp.]
MRFLVFIFLLNTAQVSGQSNPYNKLPSVSKLIDKKDSFEVRYERFIGLKQSVDTLPLFANDENSGWRNYQLVRYYSIDDSLILISFIDGQRGDYVFFFEGSHLRKIRVGNPAMGKTKSYYYTVLQNNDSEGQTNISFESGLSRKNKMILLAAGRTLKNMFHKRTQNLQRLTSAFSKIGF